jgi:histidine ammonia-lyase
MTFEDGTSEKTRQVYARIRKVVGMYREDPIRKDMRMIDARIRNDELRRQGFLK